MSDGRHCDWCGREFATQTSVRRRQVVWVRKLIRIAGSVIKVHGCVDATCNDELSELQVAQVAV